MYCIFERNWDKCDQIDSNLLRHIKLCLLMSPEEKLNAGFNSDSDLLAHLTRGVKSANEEIDNLLDARGM